MKITLAWDDAIYKLLCYLFVWTVVIMTLYPLVYVAANSLSDPYAVLRGEVVLWPVKFTLITYQQIMKLPGLKLDYFNSAFYTVVGTAVNMLLTVLMAYPLSRKYLLWRKYFLLLILFTMMFQGGLIPTYMIVRDLGLLDTRWALIIPSAIHAWNLILMKSFFDNIPKEIEEAAIIDGANELQVLMRVILPISVPALAAISLFYGVAHWNDYFQAMVYLTNDKLFPIQIFLKNVILSGETPDINMSNSSIQKEVMTQSLKYGTIMMVALPIIVVYPFIQRFFVKGITLGAIKG